MSLPIRLAFGVDKLNVPIPAPKGRCDCPSCALSRGLLLAEQGIHQAKKATESICEGREVSDMVDAYLRSEVEAVVKSRLSWPVRRRLRRALEAS